MAAIRAASVAPRVNRAVVLRWVTAIGSLIVLTMTLLPVREHVDKVHVALALLLVVLGGSAVGGRALGLTLVGLAYLDFHYFFVERYDSLVMAKPLDGLVLVAFLVTSTVAAQLLTHMQANAQEARARAAEVERLAALGAETLNAGRAEDALRRIAEVIRTTLVVDVCEILTSDAATNASDTVDGRSLRIPLMVHGSATGILHLRDVAAIHLTPEQRRFLDALSYYAALGIERVKLVAQAERAEAFRQADLLKAAMIASLSHDLRTPLTTIKALANRLRERALPEAISIEEEADRLTRLVTDLLDLSRLNAGAMPLRLELNTAEDLIGSAVRQVGGTPLSARVLITRSDDSADDDVEPLTGRFDFVQSLRALVNLIENALKYSPQDAPVEISSRRSGAQIEISVADRGPGIADSERERVFEPFYRSPDTPADVGGTGLGLAIAGRLAKEQAGEVRCESRPGGGSLFTLVLPAAAVLLDEP